MYFNRQITVIIPTLNEASSIAKVVNDLFALRTCQQCSRELPAPVNSNLERPESANDASYHDTGCQCSKPENSQQLVDQVIVCDNGSTDDTAVIANSCGAIVTREPEQGYGAACLAALAVPVEKDIVVFVDGDYSVVASELPDLVKPLINDEAELVIGSRTLGNCERGALTPPQQFGNQLASFLIRKLWSCEITDLGPFRATTQTTLNDIKMRDRRFGWTVEMQVRALQLDKRIVEIPVTTRRRIGVSKISGTLRGVIGAANGILGTIFKLYLAGPARDTQQQPLTTRDY